MYKISENTAVFDKKNKQTEIRVIMSVVQISKTSRTKKEKKKNCLKEKKH